MWGTNVSDYDALAQIFPFEVDLAASDENHKHPVYLTAYDNALEYDWSKWKVGFMNPPKRNSKPFIDRAIYWRERCSFTTVVLTEVPTWKPQTAYYIENATYTIFTTKREFISPAGHMGAGFGDAGWAVLVFTNGEWPISDLLIPGWFTESDLVWYTKGWLEQVKPIHMSRQTRML